MKHALPALVALGSIMALACAPRAEAGHSVRADLPYPYGPGGSPDDAAWSVTTGTSPGFSGITTAFNYVLQANSTIGNDQVGEVVVPAESIQFDTFAAAVPTAPYTDTSNPAGPESQIIEYTLVGDSTFGIPAGATEVQFNYDFSQVPTGTAPTTVGVNASLTFDGTKYVASGAVLPTETDNNFVFFGGKFIGSLGEDNLGDTTFTAASAAYTQPAGWCITSCAGTTTGGGGGGTTSAPEIDPSSAAAGMTLLVGGLLVMRSGRRTLKVIR